jgi:hypothetical protein
MINWRTENNEVWAGSKWMIDSGGAPQTIKAHGGHPDTIDDYLSYIQNPPIKYGDEIDPQRELPAQERTDTGDIEIVQFALRDWPCEPDVQSALGLTVEQLQHRTLVDHINMMNRIEDMNLDAKPVAVLQGWTVEDYLDCIDMYRDHGLLTDMDQLPGTMVEPERITPVRAAVSATGVDRRSRSPLDRLRPRLGGVHRAHCRAPHR